jgi:hypothetical protein
VLTQSDILKRIVLTGFDLARPIADVMTTPPHTLGGSASAYDAALEMATHGVRHILVVDAEDRLKGVISERDLFALQRIGLRQIRSGIESAADVEALQRASRDIRQLALNLLAQGIGAEQLTQFISALNDALTRRILELNLDRHDLYGVEYAWLAFGSEGRHEQTLSTDQDNGIVYVLPEWADKDPSSCACSSLPRTSTTTSPPAASAVQGNIMASNPELCLTFDEWREKFGSWIREPHPEALLNATIFFDFRVLYGDEKLAHKLRHWLLAITGGNPAFLKAMATNALDVRRRWARSATSSPTTTPSTPAASTSRSSAPACSSTPPACSPCAPASRPPAPCSACARAARASACRPRSSRRWPTASTSSSSCACATSTSTPTTAPRRQPGQARQPQRARPAHPQGSLPAGPQDPAPSQARLPDLTHELALPIPARQRPGPQPRAAGQPRSRRQAAGARPGPLPL